MRAHSVISDFHQLPQNIVLATTTCARIRARDKTVPKALYIVQL